jgi:peptidoglycan hydrolase CwlO-like protein
MLWKTLGDQWRPLLKGCMMMSCAPPRGLGVSRRSLLDGRNARVKAQGRGFRRVVASTLVLALFLAAPVLAEPVPGSGETSATPVPGADPSQDTTSTASEETTGSAVDVEVDEETEEFRRKLAEQQTVIDDFKAQLDELDRQLAIAVETYNASAEELSRTRDTLDATETDLAKARAAYDEQAALLSDRIKALYLEGEIGPLDLLLDSKSLGDFFDRLFFLTTMGKRDGALADQLSTERTRIEDDLLDLESAKLQAEALEFELEAQQIEIMLRIEERQQLLFGAQSDLLVLLQEEAARRDLEQQALLEAILSGATDIGIEVTEGTPVETAFAYHGIPYLWGGETPAGFDCSGLVLYVFSQHGIELPHYSGSQFLLGTRVAPADLKPGDVVFFGNPIHHVGVYLGAGYFIHAPRTGEYVKVSLLTERTDYAGARRYDWQQRLEPPLGASSESSSTPVEE